MLLRYFGEKMNITVGSVTYASAGKPVKTCQTIPSKKKGKTAGFTERSASDSTEVSKRMEEDKNILAQVIQYLLEEEIIKTEDGMLSKVIGL